MLGINYDAFPLISAFFLGFLTGILVTIRLLGITFSASQKVLRRHLRPPLDQRGSDGLRSQETTEAPSPDRPEHP